MRAEYKRDMNHNYLVLHGETELDTTSYQVRMLAANVIPSLLKCRFHGVDGKTLLYYEITSKQSLAMLYEQKLLDGKDLQMIFGSFVQVIEQMTEYLMNPEQILLQPEYIYMDVEKKELFFCYLPGEKREIKKQFQLLTEYVLPKINHSDECAVMLGYGVYRRALEDDFHLEHVKEELFQQREASGEMPEIQKKSDLREKVNDVLDEQQRKNFQEEEEDSLEALFGETNLAEKSQKCMEKTKIKKNGKEKNKKQQDKVYIVIPIIGTILILAILAANMMGILPWLEVGILLIFVVIISMFAAVFVYLIGRKKKKKEQAVQDLRWKKKVRLSEKNTTDVKKMINTGDEWPHQENSTEKKENNQENYGETVVLCESVVHGPASLVSREPGELATIFLKEELTIIGKLEHAADAVIPLPTVSRLHAKIRKRENEYYLADLNSRNGTSVNGKMLKADEEYLLQDEDEIDFAQARYIFLK